MPLVVVEGATLALLDIVPLGAGVPLGLGGAVPDVEALAVLDLDGEELAVVEGAVEAAAERVALRDGVVDAVAVGVVVAATGVGLRLADVDVDAVTEGEAVADDDTE